MPSSPCRWRTSHGLCTYGLTVAWVAETLPCHKSLFGAAPTMQGSRVGFRGGMRGRCHGAKKGIDLGIGRGAGGS
ncbi:MAG TPA: hypothetical protein PLJ27_12640, partial [Polyangiaceae bacterium]|nr:hypothetical protein [Polyangiaceae bacterium]